MQRNALRFVLGAQFFSALADNALLFGAIELVRQMAYPEWSIPVLQQFFVIAFIVLAPFAGVFADGFSKGRVMFWSNGLKLAGAAAMLAGLNPFLAYGLVGVGAALYSPAKYGILSDLVPNEKLISANGMMEGSTIAAILLGVVAGGKLADMDVLYALGFVLTLYVIASLLAICIPLIAPERPYHHGQLPKAFGNFKTALKTLWADRDARYSVLGTSLFWGVGATMRFLLVAWVPYALLITGNTLPANLNGATAVGIVIGAAIAPRVLKMETAYKSIGAGVALGCVIALLSTINQVWQAYALVAVVGALGGFFVVPLNALLQKRGHELVGTGSAVAVQNLAENSIMLLMVGAYTGLSHGGVTPVSTAILFGISFSVLCLWLALAWKQSRKISAVQA
ncbi:lysophospholipid transporter LplT [Oxalobacteraceae bacterium R-40]|uniref:Lysophospholipid transporter LplT n=1 Tax=Keguizhuia sedimenti TaxID=3064264 RepID=A0ABU1BTX5_9BURK|nr:lysophospholipid transporter LplT [Oxalobacteraceae bacterium R-40]